MKIEEKLPGLQGLTALEKLMNKQERYLDQRSSKRFPSSRYRFGCFSSREMSDLVLKFRIGS
jgi:hypothetical protein